MNNNSLNEMTDFAVEGVKNELETPTGTRLRVGIGYDQSEKPQFYRNDIKTWISVDKKSAVELAAQDELADFYLREFSSVLDKATFKEFTDVKATLPTTATEKPTTATTTTKKRSEMSAKEAAAFIREFGGDAYLRLPK